jgi:hypothetical protein
VLCTSVGQFFQAELVLCQFSDSITSSSHFTKTLPQELTWQNNFFMVPTPRTDPAKIYEVKEHGSFRKLAVL